MDDPAIGGPTQPKPLLSRRQPWSLTSLAFAALAVASWILWLFSGDGLLGQSAWTAVGLVSLLSAAIGVALAVVGLARREWPAALLALIVSFVSAWPITPFVLLLFLAWAVSG